MTTIAVASQNFKTITAHAGKTRRFLIYRADGTGAPVEIDRLDLPPELALHSFHERDGHHPLYDVDLLLVGSAGTNFVRRLADHGVEVRTTRETDPVTAINAWFAGSLTPGDDHQCDGHR